MLEIPDKLWLSSGLAITTCLSALILSIQRGFYNKIQLPLEDGNDQVTVKYDQDRDPNVPFADTDRIPRILFGTSMLTLLSIYGLYSQVLTFDKHVNDQQSVYGILSSTFILITWLYALALTIVSRRYQFPSQWGFVLNVHLCIIYFVAWFISLHDIWTAFTTNPGMPWLNSLPLVLQFLLLTDMVYTTATTDRGAPFVDENGKSVTAIDVSSIWSYLTFSWVTPLVHLAYSKQKLTDDDLPTLPPIFRGRNLFYIFGEHRDSSLLLRIYLANRTAIHAQIVLAFVSSFFYYAPAYFVNQLLILIQDIGSGKAGDDAMSHGILIIAGLGASVVVVSLIVAQLWYFAGSSVQVRVKAMLNIEIYRKTLRRMDMAVSSGNKEKDGKQDKNDDNGKNDDNKKKEDDGGEEEEDVSSSTGTIVNLMSTDSNRISEFSTWWFSVLAAPTELCIGIYFLYHLLGVSCFLGLLVMVVTLPANHYNAKLFAKSQDRLMEARDKRVNLMNEVLQGIRQIKFFAWEANWEKRVMDARKIELKHLRTGYLAELGFNFLWQGSPILVTIVSFYSFTKLEGKELTAPIAFTAITVFNELRFALNVLPEVFIEWLQALISIRRIDQYLNEPEIVPPPKLDANEPVKLSFKDATVGFKRQTIPSISVTNTESDDGTATPSDESDGFILKDLNLEFPNNELSLICGATGSGKTLMMLSLLGEAVLLEGQVSCPRVEVADTVTDEFKTTTEIDENDWILDHAVAYVAQTAWLQNASIRDNILFGLPYIEKRYKDTLEACSLVKDLSILEDGDMTEIGEKGITLSGGQKARVALARAVYSRAKNVLMDDVLSAVDAHTAKHLYDKCLMGPLMNNRTRVLITHHVKLCLSGATYLVHIRSGRTDLVGSPSDLRRSGELNTILEEEKNQDLAEQEEEAIETTNSVPTNATEADTSDDTKKAPRVLVEEENRATGMVKLRLYSMYLKMVGSPFFWLLVAILLFGSRGLDVTESWWIKNWARSYEVESPGAHVSSVTSVKNHPTFSYLSLPMATSNDMRISSKSDDDLNYYLGIYVLITSINILVATSRFAVIYYGILRASRILYAELLHRVLRAPLRFFDTTPIGRILNRFAKDIETIDSTIPNDLLNFVIQWIVVFSSIIAVSFVLPAFVIPMIMVAAINIALGVMFVSTSRELRRMDSVSRSPLFSHFTETIVGVATIRAFGATRRFLQDMITRVDVNARPYYNVWLVNRWVSVRYAFMGAAINVVTSLIILMNLKYIDSSLAGFCLSFILLYSDEMFWAIRRYTSLEMSFNAVERVVEFMEMDQEPPAISQLRPPAEWPKHGAIDVRNLEVRYAPDLPAVLHDLSFSVNPQEKVGVVGTTGSGKSTLALSFFRFVEASKGSIVIDNIDISDLGTEDLRSNLTIIPQDPTLFSGTLRSNMDPFDQFSDDDIFIALRRVHLIPSDDDTIDETEIGGVNSNVFKDLDTNVSEGGKNFSQGQRQLLCLARALLKRSRIVLMDEATASVDFETDKKIQRTIATEFADCTILCIAHRLLTVVEYDRILVLHHGKILEYDSPINLINNSDSAFHKMCRKSGEYETLLAAAKGKQLVDTE
ncbi:P-loop containing nucleoside triphosphate hydrolase protein [Halteromyces radiatus]|uniref:P-loop containing nucleoside triphosphate hydrolase protein n=1 Tax=Halteromyces radiatus TaxID=101107 RepID=UPI0022201D0D|nr:P-loop containing nucleoside triphosphate hydrolase protein [Halteromyces radiatus]KAI8084874.1 P-loop containing nucleoside triphosphate hydrolase protein [Halteromyces radiatus]